MRTVGIGLVLALTLQPLGAWGQSAPPKEAPPASVTQPPKNAPSVALKQARSKMRAACGADLQKFCANVERGKGGIQRCLRDHRAELSPEGVSARSDVQTVRRQERTGAK